MSNYSSFANLFSKWMRADVPPEIKDVELSANKNVMAWRWLFFYKCRVMTVDVRKVFFPSNSGRAALVAEEIQKTFSTSSIIVLSFNRILN